MSSGIACYPTHPDTWEKARKNRDRTCLPARVPAPLKQRRHCFLIGLERG